MLAACGVDEGVPQNERKRGASATILFELDESRLPCKALDDLERSHYVGQLRLSTYVRWPIPGDGGLTSTQVQAATLAGVFVGSGFTMNVAGLVEQTTNYLVGVFRPAVDPSAIGALNGQNIILSAGLCGDGTCTRDQRNGVASLTPEGPGNAGRIVIRLNSAPNYDAQDEGGGQGSGAACDGGDQ